ncbi:MAG: sodium-dependent transporter [Clostridia bacterium]|nr:sodium-dependent transporter [Clostridia bacterium]
MLDSMENKGRSSFGSKFGFIMAAVGSAVGLGNIWRFPYIAGTYGGGLFLLLYIAIVAILGFSMLTLEFVIGRNRNANVIDAFATGKKKRSYIGWLCILIPFLIVSYYNVIGGWIIKYLTIFVTGGDFGSAGYEGTFGEFTSDPVASGVFTIIFLALCIIVLIFGVQKGIEKVSKILMPALFVMLVFMAIVSLTMPGAIEGLKFMFVPNFESIEANGGFLQMLSAATGQAFYSLSVGMGIAVTYGSYLKKDQSIPQNALSVCGLDTMVAIFSGLAVLPAIFAVGIAPSAGPGLVFISFPAVFESLGGFGVVAGILFFLLVLFAAWTSAISLLEVLISALEEKTKLSRKGATLVVAVVISITSILVAISMQPEGLFGVNLLDLFDSLTTYVMLPLTGLLMCFFLIKVIGMKAAKEELLLNCKVKKLGSVWEFAIKFVVPVLIAFILVMGILTWTKVI